MTFSTLMVKFDSVEEFDHATSTLRMKGVTIWECCRGEAWAEFDVSGFTAEDFLTYFGDPQLKLE